mmetsp:Transcript_20081/g.65273  ORF Transcript_20081/g.65273 Transcript_20081/m.65273 type:complete len:355 (+) Transcript_20081:1657-2721(+)
MRQQPVRVHLIHGEQLARRLAVARVDLAQRLLDLLHDLRLFELVAQWHHHAGGLWPHGLRPLVVGKRAGHAARRPLRLELVALITVVLDGGGGAARAGNDHNRRALLCGGPNGRDGPRAALHHQQHHGHTLPLQVEGLERHPHVDLVAPGVAPLVLAVHQNEVRVVRVERRLVGRRSLVRHREAAALHLVQQVAVGNRPVRSDTDEGHLYAGLPERGGHQLHDACVRAARDDPRAGGGSGGGETFVERVLQDRVQLDVLRRPRHRDDHLRLLNVPKLFDKLGQLRHGGRIRDDQELGLGVGLGEVHRPVVGWRAVFAAQDSWAKATEDGVGVEVPLLNQLRSRVLQFPHRLVLF